LLLASSDAATACRLLDRGSNVNATASLDFTTLHWVVAHQRRELSTG
jgi:hypothetical protein